jgi:hypothetical protein
MRPIITLLILLCIVQKSEARLSHSTTSDQTTARLLHGNFSSLFIPTIKSRPAFKKNKLLTLLLKLKKQNTEDTEKERNKKKAIVSAVAGALSVFLFILTLILADGFAALGGVILSIIAIVMGMKALRRSKKFTDGNNSGRSAAMAGIILGCIGFAAFLLWTIIGLSGMS